MSHLTPGTILTVLLVCMASYTAYVAYPVYRALQIGKTLTSAAVPYEQHPEKPTSAILVAGDSTAVGTGSVNNTDSTAGRVGKQYPDADIKNIGVNGEKLAELLVLLQQIPPSKTYDLILLQIGANDIVGLTPLSRVSSELSEVLSQARAHSEKVIVLTSGNVGLAPAFRFPLSFLFQWRTLQVRNIFMSETSTVSGVTYIDLFNYRKDEIFNTDSAKYYAPDGFHPSGAGYGVWFERIKSAL